MKTLLCTISLIFLTSSLCFAQRTFNFKIDNQVYHIDEKGLNDLFGNAFNDMVANGRSESRYFDLWVGSYNQWKEYVVKGTLAWDTYGNRIANTTFTGPEIPNEFMGLKANGKPASGNENKANNVSRRIQAMNFWLGRQLIRYFTNKEIVLS